MSDDSLTAGSANRWAAFTDKELETLTALLSDAGARGLWAHEQALEDEVIGEQERRGPDGTDMPGPLPQEVIGVFTDSATGHRGCLGLYWTMDEAVAAAKSFGEGAYISSEAVSGGNGGA